MRLLQRIPLTLRHNSELCLRTSSGFATACPHFIKPEKRATTRGRLRNAQRGPRTPNEDAAIMHSGARRQAEGIQR